ncbi:uncharacterized protein EV420DRAFT_1268652 [Desarmillaria tabescens]|uniref:RING-type domain-containing protein n=1 Tax=Armillaria tabescens TaxID=1929756 RepID=A0AA39KH02_ARMTA|nr:uncharacterized protein EV420DRAFT_1268652 [Desarmillaria tabescens]KAK0459579.1 hypothetical protein EV420DRAFT_1268652 [Desarmillaria tabescens]
MGNSSSSSGRGHHDDTVDFGHLSPQGVYTGPRDWNQAVVSQLICARRLAPFYRPLEDYDESWDDDQILAARKELPDPENADQMTRIEAAPSSNGPKTSSKRPSTLKEPARPEASVYRGAVECPICFLYYPPNINHSRCCDHPICTECFVQIKRSEPTTTHLVSDPAACPYCVQEHFGVVYTPPPWRTGIGSDGAISPWSSDSPKGSQPSIPTAGYPTHKRRQKSFSADSPEVVTIDQIRPDWEAKLAAVRAAVTRRANRRIIMRQVGDRLIPVGVTSGRVHALSPEEAAAAAENQDTGGSRRSRRRQQASANQGFEQYIGLGGQDLEELMVMEAMRLSLLEHEEQQRKEAEEKRKAANASDPEAAAATTTESSGAGSSALEVPPSDRTSGSLTSTPSTSLTPPSPAGTEYSPSKRRSFIPSRSRTPSPPTDLSWRKQSPNPAPFSTLNAALSATSTASAVLNASHDPSSTNATINEPQTSYNPTHDIPAITIGIPPESEPTNWGGQQSKRPPPIHTNSQPSSVHSADSQTAPGSSYDNLPSSPESMTQEPLLSESEAVAYSRPRTPTGDESRDEG